VAAPLTALTLTPGGASKKAPLASSTTTASEPVVAGVPADIPHLIAKGVSTSVTTAVAAVAPSDIEIDAQDRQDAIRDALAASRGARAEAVANARETRAQVLVDTREAVANARAQVRLAVRGRDPIDEIIEMKAVGVTPDYVNEMR